MPSGPVDFLGFMFKIYLCILSWDMQILSHDDLPESFICVQMVVGCVGKERANDSPIVAKYELNRFDFSSSFTARVPLSLLIGPIF